MLLNHAADGSENWTAVYMLQESAHKPKESFQDAYMPQQTFVW